MAQRPGLLQEGIELRGRDANGVAAVAIAAVSPVGNAALLEVAAQLLHQRVDVAAGLVEVQRLHLHVAGVDLLGGPVGLRFAVVVRRSARLLGFIGHVLILADAVRVGGGVPVAASVVAGRRSAVSGCSGITAAACQQQGQHQRQQERYHTFHGHKPPSFWDLPAYVTLAAWKKFPVFAKTQPTFYKSPAKRRGGAEPLPYALGNEIEDFMPVT